MIAVPQRLEDAVGEAQHQNVLDGFFAEEMIDAVDLVLGQHLEDLGVESPRRGKVMPEGLLNDHPPPCFLRLVGEAGAAELLDHRTKEPVSDRQIEQDIGCAVLPAELLGQQLLEPAVSFRLRKISANIMHALHEPCPGRLVERLPLAAGPSEGLNHAGQVLAPSLGGLIVTVDADQGEVFRKLPAPDEIVESWHDETLGQIAGGAENHHGRGGRPAAGKALSDRRRGVSGSCRRRCARVAR